MRPAALLIALAVVVSAAPAVAGQLHLSDPDAEIPYVPPRRIIAPPLYSYPGPVIFPRAPLPDGTFCSPPYDFCEPDPDTW